jgi:uncharacterized protein (DUF2141 family)
VLRWALRGAFFLLIAPAAAHAADLTVTVEDLRSAKGKLSLGLYSEKDDWPDGKPSYEPDIPARQGTITYVFKNLPPGRYALSGFHDENANGKLDSTFIGLPEEGFVFSNDAAPKLSAPSFQSCAVTIADKPVAITVHVQYWGSSR